MNLAEYMQAESLTDAAMAERLAAHAPQQTKTRVTIGRYRRGIEPIPGETVKALVELSSGKMTANELLGIAEREAAE